MTDSFSAAIHYAQRYGFSCFPAYGIDEKTDMSGQLKLMCVCGNLACASPGKHPAISKGLNAASKDIAVLENLWAGRADRNIGIATGVISGIFVVDVDGEAGRTSLAELPPLPKTLTCRTARGNHYFFKYPSKKVFNRTHVWRNIDIRGDGGYVISAPSRHISGVYYEWLDPDADIAEAPQWLIDKVCADKKAPVVNDDLLAHAGDKEWSADDVRDMLTCLDSSGPREYWINMGMALHSGGYDFGLWDDWSSKSHKYNKSDTLIQWRSFKPDGGITMGTLIGEAKLQGWKPKDYVSEPIDWPTHPAREFAIKMGIYKPYPAEQGDTPPLTNEPTNNIVPIKDDYEGWPTHLTVNPMEIDGLIGDTVRWIVGCSYKEQPELTLLNTLACLSAVFGRRYTNPTNIRTNLFCCGIADTGKGKDNSRKMLKSLMKAAGLETYLAGDAVVSGAGIVTQMEVQASNIMMIDEFGMVLASISGAQAAQHHIDISTKMLSIFTSSGGVWNSGTYADKKKEPVTLIDPNLCCYGCSTKSTYLDALKKASIKNGFLNRFLVIDGRSNPKKNRGDLVQDIPDDLIAKWQAFAPSSIGEMNKNIMLASPIVVQWGECKPLAEALSDKEDALTTRDDGMGSLFERYRELTLKVAAIFAICDNPQTPVYSKKYMELSEKIVSCSLHYLLDLAANEMYENLYEKSRREVMMQIREYGREGVNKRDLMRRNSAIKAKEFDDIIKALLDEERIVADQVKTATRTRVIYKAC